MKRWRHLERKKIHSILYITAVMAVCLIPSVGMFSGTAKHRIFADLPSIKTEEGDWNPDWLPELNDYFQEHFAFREELVTANAAIRSRLFGVSAEDGVIDGTDGWLYYADSLDDYLGQNLLEERELYNIAHSLALMQEAALADGGSFLFVPVPNKNTLYGEHMPYYARYKVSEMRNLKRLYPILESEGVQYLNLEQEFRASEEVLYHKTDSHWTNRGAALAGEKILDRLGKHTVHYREGSVEKRADFTGDLAGMLYPWRTPKEEEYYYGYEPAFSCEGEITSYFDPKIRTVSEAADGSLVMYRDSFGNALLPFVAEGYGSAYFSRGEPFHLADLELYQADTLVIERAERFLPNLAQNAAVMEAPKRTERAEVMTEKAEVMAAQKQAENKVSILDHADIFLREADEAQGEWIEGSETLSYRTYGRFLEIEGSLDLAQQEAASDRPGDRSGIASGLYLRLDGEEVYEAFPVTVVRDGVRNPYGYRLFLPMEELNSAFYAEIIT